MKRLVVERDPGDPLVWRYGVDRGGGVGEWRQLRFDPESRQGGPIGESDDLYVSAILLVRMAGGEDRLGHNLDPFDIPLPALPAGPRGEGEWVRATAGRAKGGSGSTLGERSQGV